MVTNLKPTMVKATKNINKSVRSMCEFLSFYQLFQRGNINLVLNLQCNNQLTF
jgi:hypothetical protein